MDRYYIEQIIALLEKEKGQHDRKFAANPAHRDCLPRFDTAINRLRSELAKETGNFCKPDPTSPLGNLSEHT